MLSKLGQLQTNLSLRHSHKLAGMNLTQKRVSLNRKASKSEFLPIAEVYASRGGLNSYRPPSIDALFSRDPITNTDPADRCSETLFATEASMKIQSIEKTHTHDGLVRLRVCFDKADLHLKTTPFGVTMTLGDCTTIGEPGGPALPRISIHIAVPEGAWPARLEVQSARTIRLTDEPIFVAPIQPLRPGATQPPKPPPAQHRPVRLRPAADGAARRGGRGRVCRGTVSGSAGRAA